MTTGAANAHCSPHAAVRLRTHLERILLSAHAVTYLRSRGSRVGAMVAGERLDSETPLWQVVLNACSWRFPSGGAVIATLM